MRRWNGWGDDAIHQDVPASALRWLQARIGPGHVAPDATYESMLARVPASRLPPHALIDRDAAPRLRAAMGESYRDWICKRCGELPALPDGVARPENSGQVRELLDAAVAQRLLAARARDDPAADGGVVERLRTVPEHEAVRTQLRLNQRPRRAGFEARDAARRIEVQQPLHAA